MRRRILASVGGAPLPYDWVDGFYLTNRGVLTPYDGRSVSGKIIIPAGKSVRWVSDYACYVVGYYRSTGSYWNDVSLSNITDDGMHYRDWAGYSSMFFQYSCSTSKSSRCYVYNLTDDEYIMKDNVIADKYKFEG